VAPPWLSKGGAALRLPEGPLPGQTSCLAVAVSRWDKNRLLLDPRAPLVSGRRSWAQRDEREEFQTEVSSCEERRGCSAVVHLCHVCMLLSHGLLRALDGVVWCDVHHQLVRAAPAPGSTRVHQGPPGSTRVHQGPPGSTRVHQGPPGSTRVHQGLLVSLVVVSGVIQGGGGGAIHIGEVGVECAELTLSGG
jgi:hypothetical protein